MQLSPALSRSDSLVWRHRSAANAPVIDGVWQNPGCVRDTGKLGRRGSRARAACDGRVADRHPPARLLTLPSSGGCHRPHVNSTPAPHLRAPPAPSLPSVHSHHPHPTSSMTEPLSTLKTVVSSVLPSNPEPNSPAQAKAEHTLAQGGETDHGLPLEGKRAEIMRETLNLYQLNPSLEFLKEVWVPETGIFEDGVCFARGFEEYAPQCEFRREGCEREGVEGGRLTEECWGVQGTAW